MKKTIGHHSTKIGLPPGALIHIGKKTSDSASIEVIDFDEKNWKEYKCADTKDIAKDLNHSSVRWINVNGLHDVDMIAQIGSLFSLDDLLLEDLLNTSHRPKVDEFENHLFLTFKMLGLNKKGTAIVSEQLSLVLGDNWVISFQEMEGDIFDPIRAGIRENKGLVRKRKADYLFYRLVDIVVDNYFYVSDFFNSSIEALEEQVLTNSDSESLASIQKLKKQLISVRRMMSPLREALVVLQNIDSNLIDDRSRPYFRDVFEHVIQLNETIDSSREMISSIRDLHMTGLSNRMNQIMKLLTIISTIFIPLTFIAGIYGMNFDNIPELHWGNGYFITWAVMVMITIVMIILFRRKGWL